MISVESTQSSDSLTGSQAPKVDNADIKTERGNSVGLINSKAKATPVKRKNQSDADSGIRESPSQSGMMDGSKKHQLDTALKNIKKTMM